MRCGKHPFLAADIWQRHFGPGCKLSNMRGVTISRIAIAGELRVKFNISVPTFSELFCSHNVLNLGKGILHCILCRAAVICILCTCPSTFEEACTSGWHFSVTSTRPCPHLISFHKYHNWSY